MKARSVLGQFPVTGPAVTVLHEYYFTNSRNPALVGLANRPRSAAPCPLPKACSSRQRRLTAAQGGTIWHSVSWRTRPLSGGFRSAQLHGMSEAMRRVGPSDAPVGGMGMRPESGPLTTRACSQWQWVPPLNLAFDTLRLMTLRQNLIRVARPRALSLG